MPVCIRAMCDAKGSLQLLTNSGRRNHASRILCPPHLQHQPQGPPGIELLQGPAPGGPQQRHPCCCGGPSESTVPFASLQ